MARRFNPIDFYRKAGKTLSVAPRKRKRTKVSKVPLSTSAHLFNELGDLGADYITGEREKKRATAARAEMKDVLSAYYDRGGQPAYDAVANASMDMDETSDDVDRDAGIAFNRSGGIDAVNALAPPVSLEAQDMRIALMGDAYSQRQAREAAELKRSQENEDYETRLRLKQRLGLSDDKTPATVAEWRVYQGMDASTREKYLNMKRAGKWLNLGDRFVRPNQADQTQDTASRVTGTPPKVAISGDRVVKVAGSPGAPGSLGAPSAPGAPGAPGVPSVSNVNQDGVKITDLPPSTKDVKKQENRRKQTLRAGTTVIQDLQRGLDLVTNDWSSISAATAGVAKNLPLTDAKTLNGYIESALSNVGLDTLQTMRENSPTGGALGQVPIQQQRRLEQVLGSLDITQRPEILQENLKRVINIYKDISYGTVDEIENLLETGKISVRIAKGASERHPLSFDEFGKKISNGITQSAIDAGVTQVVWDNMSAKDKKLFK